MCFVLKYLPQNEIEGQKLVCPMQVKWLSKKYVLHFFADFELLMFHDEQVELVENLPQLYLPYQFYYGNQWKYSNVFKPVNRIKLFVHR